VKYYFSPHARGQSGSGRGLFLVKRMLELLAGDIWCESYSDAISFCFWLRA
jgi:signal transduction histidine kinase